MTDTEIIKALSCCRDYVPCKNYCPYAKYKCTIDRECIPKLCEDALDLITRQKAEIELWQNEYKRACAERDAHIATTKFIRAEAVKEFADKFDDVLWDMKVQYDNRGLISYGCVCEVIHEKLLKTIREMEGESNGK